LNWPEDHTGWRVQTNSSGITDTNAWGDIDLSTSTNSVEITLDPSVGQMFIRMVYP
jgi:hypothetical protein